MSPTIPQLRALVAVAEHGSFTAAAHALRVSQSAVSHALAGLERELDGQLVARTTPLVVAPLGQRILAHAKAAVASIDALERAAKGDRALHGRVRIGAVPTVCQGLLPSLIEQWAIALPDVEIAVYEGDDDEMPQWLEAGVVDAAVLVAPSETPEGSLLVYTDEFAALVREDHPLAGLDAIPLEELSDDGLIVSTGGCETHVQRMHDDAGLDCAVQHRVREMGTLFSMVLQGQGVSIVPTLGRVMVPKGLVMRSLEHPRQRQLVLSGPSSRAWDPLTTALVDALRE